VQGFRLSHLSEVLPNRNDVGWRKPCARLGLPEPYDFPQILSAIGEGPNNLKGWRGTFIPARIAGLTQHFAHRDSPMPSNLAQKFLRILDILVDMGDRRSAALQLGEAFREIRLTSSS
jgi:hypothetical protein